MPQQKYEAEGNPTLPQCFDLIGNADAHAKNMAILLTDHGPQLAPFYDFISTAIYENMTNKLAMKIGCEDRTDWLQARHWKKFADSVFMKPNLVGNTLADMIDIVLPQAQSIALKTFSAYGKNNILEIILPLNKKESS